MAFLHAGAVSFSEMSAAQVASLLAESPAASRGNADPAAKAAAASRSASAVTVTADDLITKVYGLVDPASTRKECIRETERLILLTPKEDQGALWLDPADGYVVDYYGMRPDCSAMARFDGQKDESQVSDYCFFFLFPYEAERRVDTEERQIEFCGTLLQEISDIGAQMGVNYLSEDVFEAIGDYKGHLVDIRLLNETEPAMDPEADDSAANGRYILMLSVEPNAYTAADELTAALD